MLNEEGGKKGYNCVDRERERERRTPSLPSRRIVTNSLRLWDPATMPPLAAISPRLPQNFAGRREWFGIQSDMRNAQEVERKRWRASSSKIDRRRLRHSHCYSLFFTCSYFFNHFPGGTRPAVRVYRLLRLPTASAIPTGCESELNYHILCIRSVVLLVHATFIIFKFSMVY